jgi:Amt family ammonium transporter
VFAEHGIGGMVGLIFVGLFANDSIIALDGVNAGVVGGFVDHNYALLYKQVAMVAAASGYAFVVSAVLAKAIDCVPGLRLRATDEAELLGMDDDQHGEFSYDYVEVRRDFLAWSPQMAQQMRDGTGLAPQLGIDHGQGGGGGGGGGADDDARDQRVLSHHGVPIGAREEIETARTTRVESRSGSASEKAVGSETDRTM